MSSHKRQRIQRESVGSSRGMLELLYPKERKKNGMLDENVCKNIEAFGDS